MEPNKSEVCLGVGPTAPAGTYGLVQFIILTIICIFMLITAIATLYMRNFRRRLRLRSILPIVSGSFVAIILIMIRASYDLIGIEYFPCTLTMSMHYLNPVFVVGPDLVSIASFLAKQYKRQTLNSNTLLALDKLEHEVEVTHRRTTVREFFLGLWNFLLALAELTSLSGKIDEKFWARIPHQRISPLRELAYESVAVLIYASAFIIALIIRINTMPPFSIEAGCTGCLMNWQDLLILSTITLFLGIPVSLMAVRTRRHHIPDPLGYINDMEVSAVLTSPLVLACGVLYSTDPNGLMKSQQVDWFIFEMAAMIYVHCLKTVVQLYRTRRIQKLGEQNVRLLDVLADAKGALLFEKHLIAELANENLLFWREAIKYKLQFDKNRDFDVSQQTAKVIYRTFLSPQAVLPINIGDEIKKNIDTRFKGAVGRTVFDEALVEVYLMMQNGAFRRFVNSPAYKEYAKTRADFSMSTAGVFNPMAIIPGVVTEAESGFARNLDIKDYVKSL
jgi:hypothetical protein